MLPISALVEGRGRSEVAALFRVSVRAVDKWWARWQASGRDALLSRPRGRRAGDHQVLSEAEQAREGTPLGCDSGQLRHCAVTGDRVQRDPQQRPHPLRYPQRLLFDRELLADGLWT
ncbi:helix-turn-helix domain-containing protein [Streptomyces sp. NPDC001070]